jgi:putative peptide zinc metalloprotease protein
VEWPESDIIELLRGPTRFIDLYAAFVRRSPLKPTPNDMGAYLAELEKRGWLRAAPSPDARFRGWKTGGLTAWFSGLLFVRIPLLRPEAFLRATVGAVRALINPLTRILFLLCGAAGLYLALPRWEEYWNACAASLRLGTIPSVFIALVAVKLIHEFAHAYAATLAGARVSGMGVAFIFCLPLPYTDVTDAWRLSWSGRLRVASAGIQAEMALAGVTLLLWALSPPGETAETLARLSSVAVASTLLTNLNPGPRFDGYYMLCCLLRLENLRSRGMGELRRLIWKRLFGIGTPDVFIHPARMRQRGALLYALYAVFYRVSLGLGLALMAYSLLPRAFALPVVIGELWLFIAGPVVIETVCLARNWRGMRMTAGLLILLAALGGACLWFFGSWPRRAHFPGVARAASEREVRTRRSGSVAAVAARRGGRVAAGDVLARLEDPADSPLLRHAEWALREAGLSEAQAWRDDDARLEAPARDAELKRRRVELDALRERGKYLDVFAPMAGVVVDWDETLVPGTPVGQGVTMGRIADGPVSLLSCYPDMETAGRLETGMAVRFFPDSGEGFVEGRIVGMERSRPEILEDAELARVLGAVESGGTLVLPKPYAKVAVELLRPLSRSGQTGRVWIWTRPESLAGRTLGWLRALAVRESAF